MTTIDVSMAIVYVPPHPSLLGIPQELRQKILKHLFAGSLVKISAPQRLGITTNLQPDVVAACKQLHVEGQDLLIAMTTLYILFYDQSWVRWVPLSVANLYLGKVQEVQIDVSEGCSAGFDIHPLPSLKGLQVSDFDGLFGYVSRTIHRTPTIDKKKWVRILDGEIDEKAFIEGWLLKARSFRRAQAKDPDNHYGPNNTSWLLGILDNDVRTPPKLIVEGEETILYDISDEVEADKKERAVVIVSVHDLHVSELFKSQALTCTAEITLRSQNA